MRDLVHPRTAARSTTPPLFTSPRDGKCATSSTPIGYGGKIDDTSVVCAEVVEYTKQHCAWARKMRTKQRIRKYRKQYGAALGGYALIMLHVHPCPPVMKCMTGGRGYTCRGGYVFYI